MNIPISKEKLTKEVYTIKEIAFLCSGSKWSYNRIRRILEKMGLLDKEAMDRGHYLISRKDLLIISGNEKNFDYDIAYSIKVNSDDKHVIPAIIKELCEYIEDIIVPNYNIKDFGINVDLKHQSKPLYKLNSLNSKAYK